MNTASKITKVLSLYMKSAGTIKPHFFLTGSTGSGKTFTVTQIADQFGISVININSAQLTNEGIAGNSISKALAELETHQGTPVIVFFDEFDKAISTSAETTAGTVQAEVLKLLEDSTTEVFGKWGKYNRVQVDNVLFIFAGSFAGAKLNNLSDLLDHNVQPELLGRVGLHFHVEKTPISDLLSLVKESPLIREYTENMEGIKHSKAVADISKELTNQFENNIIGVRIINSLTHQYFINGGFSEITKRRTVANKKKVDTPITFN